MNAIGVRVVHLALRRWLLVVCRVQFSSLHSGTPWGLQTGLEGVS